MQKSIDRLKHTATRCREQAQNLRHQALSLEEKACSYLEAADMIVDDFRRANASSTDTCGETAQLKNEIRGLSQ